MSYNTDKHGRKMALIVDVDTSDFSSNCDIIRVAFEPIVYGDKNEFSNQKHFMRFEKNYSHINSSMCYTNKKVSYGASASHNLSNNHLDYADGHASDTLKVIMPNFEYVIVASAFEKSAIERAMRGQMENHKFIYLDRLSYFFDKKLDSRTVAALYWCFCTNEAHLDGHRVVGAPYKATTMISILNGMCRAYCSSLDDLYDLSEACIHGTTEQYMENIRNRSKKNKGNETCQ